MKNYQVLIGFIILALAIIIASIIISNAISNCGIDIGSSIFNSPALSR